MFRLVVLPCFDLCRSISSHVHMCNLAIRQGGGGGKEKQEGEEAKEKGGREEVE